MFEYGPGPVGCGECADGRGGEADGGFAGGRAAKGATRGRHATVSGQGGAVKSDTATTGARNENALACRQHCG